MRGILGDERDHRLRLRLLRRRSNRRAFAKIYEYNLWSEAESRSGHGSTLEFSIALRQSLPSLLIELDARSLLDVGCGDFNWMRTVELDAIQYTGLDVVEALIKRNTELYGSPYRSFFVGDVTEDRLPAADVALCRHCLIHLPNRQVLAAIRNIKASGAKYLLATTYPEVLSNVDIWPGGFRPVNMQLKPFNLPPPLRSLNDSPIDDRILGVWRFADLEIG